VKKVDCRNSTLFKRRKASRAQDKKSEDKGKGITKEVDQGINMIYGIFYARFLSEEGQCA
jgi:hypothetical protein